MNDFNIDRINGAVRSLNALTRMPDGNSAAELLRDQYDAPEFTADEIVEESVRLFLKESRFSKWEFVTEPDGRDLERAMNEGMLADTVANNQLIGAAFRKACLAYYNARAIERIESGEA